MKMPVLINGFPRSGTTFLYLQMYKNFEDKALNEPLWVLLGNYIQAYLEKLDKTYGHPYFKKEERLALIEPYIKNFGEKIFEMILKYYPAKDGKHHFIWEYEKLIKYMSFFKEYHIKEVTLHFYLNDEFFKENWEIYHIIRYPCDVFMSIFKGLYKIKSGKLFLILKKKEKNYLARLLKQHILKTYNFNPCYLIDIAEEIRTIYGTADFKITDPIDAFIFSWTIANYYAIKSLPSDHIIIYEKPETYKRLPFELKDPLRIKIYPKAREDLQYEFEKIAKRLEIEEEYNYLLRFFE